MDKNKIIAIVVAAAIVVFVVGVAFLTKRSPRALPGGAGAGAGGGAAQAPTGPVTREAAPQNVVVPSQGAKDVPQDVAIPDSVSPASQVSNASNRGFSISIDNNTYTPNTVIVSAGDVVAITVTAVDKDYDITQPDFGFKAVIPKGTTKKITLGTIAPAGKYLFYCSSCGGPDKGPTGYLIAAAK